ncbi:MAG: hypothetical protein ACLU9S_00510 [Oscillospiraceae bacterium]
MGLVSNICVVSNAEVRRAGVLEARIVVDAALICFSLIPSSMEAVLNVLDEASRWRCRTGHEAFAVCECSRSRETASRI